MKSLIFIFAVLIKCCWSYDSFSSNGAGAFTYEDPAGHRDVIANIENQERKVFEAAQNSFGAFNEFPYIPTFNFRYPSNDPFNNFGPGNYKPFDMSGKNTPYNAFAFGAVGPGFKHQIAAINPSNPQSPNVQKFSHNPDRRNDLNNHFYSVHSSASSSSINKNGELQSQKAAETIVNDNGKVTKYSVHS
ncbi:unnamed protein product [Parnassius apollo]|uniref:(apollo) hypothetical protein n=1 Tax=Parnassius apollo TaxID=110799 RepID=A0A8S3WTU8_PARAO|nr:unnamed protein product [Parnassius apollo]